MKIEIIMSKKEANAVNEVTEVYKDLDPSIKGCIEVEEAHKGFSLKNYLSGTGAYHMTLSVPEWVVCEYSRLGIKYHSKMVQVAMIFKQFEMLLGDWEKEIKADISEIKSKYMK